MTSPLHSQQTANHRLESWVYADAATREAATGFAAADLGQIAYQADTGSYWRLTAVTPTWAAVAGATAELAVVTTVASPGSDTHLPTEQAVREVLPGLEREFVFVAEFAGAVLQADGSANTGTLTAAHDSTNHKNYYNWTTAEGTTQDYDLALQFRLPPEFASWKSGDVNVYMTSQVSATPGATGVRLDEFLDGSGTNRITASTKQNAAWTEDAYAITGGAWAAGDLVTARVKLLADAAKNAMLHMIRIPWTAQ